jgi:phosphoribosylformimino-5-aminoimidazole carboxamide ribotide isomerase
VIVFPAVDIQGGKAVRLRRGDFGDVTVFGEDPVELARMWEAQGAEALHVVDLDAARTGELANFTIVERIVKALDIPVQYGGGIRTPTSLALIAGIGVRWVVMGTAAVTALDLLDDAVAWLGERLVVGLDCSDGMVATHGWQQRSQMSSVKFARILVEHDVKRVVYTDTARDGMLGGPNLIGLRDLAETTSLEIVLSGGIALLDDLRRLRRLALPTVVGVIVGRALYEDAFSLAAAQAAVAAQV